jgi:endonuclease-3
VRKTELDLMACWPREEWGKRHLQLIEFGRQYCPARSHDPAGCPICKWATPRARRRAS